MIGNRQVFTGVIQTVATLGIYLFFLPGLSGQETKVNQPRILVFNGLPGDALHHAFFEKNLSEIRKSLLERFKIPGDRIDIYYGPKEQGYSGPATRENVLLALSKLVEQVKASEDGSLTPVWIFFHGHANRIPGGANLNLPGPDLSTRELAKALKDFPQDHPLVIFAGTAAAPEFMKSLGGKGRIVIAASVPRDPVTEPEFPSAIATALASKETDANNDKQVTALELFLATKQEVIKLYKQESYLVRENTQLDGNGDGEGTQRPADIDAEPAKKVFLRLPQQSKFE